MWDIIVRELRTYTVNAYRVARFAYDSVMVWFIGAASHAGREKVRGRSAHLGQVAKSLAKLAASDSLNKWLQIYTLSHIDKWRRDISCFKYRDVWVGVDVLHASGIIIIIILTITTSISTCPRIPPENPPLETKDLKREGSRTSPIPGEGG